MARSSDAIMTLSRDPRWKKLTGNPQDRLWTDDYSGILQVLAFPWKKQVLN
ncbi:MAG: hypothetical protein AB1656_07595 [Candidatus Omnitrophota bacterium]